MGAHHCYAIVNKSLFGNLKIGYRSNASTIDKHTILIVIYLRLDGLSHFLFLLIQYEKRVWFGYM